jgi:hypothetical protein
VAEEEEEEELEEREELELELELRSDGALARVARSRGRFFSFSAIFDTHHARSSDFQ